MTGLVRVAKFAMATFAAMLLVYQAVEDSIVQVSMVISILVFALCIFLISVSMAVSVALQVSRALFNYFTTHPDSLPIPPTTTGTTMAISRSPEIPTAFVMPSILQGAQVQTKAQQRSSSFMPDISKIPANEARSSSNNSISSSLKGTVAEHHTLRSSPVITPTTTDSLPIPPTTTGTTMAISHSPETPTTLAQVQTKAQQRASSSMPDIFEIPANEAQALDVFIQSIVKGINNERRRARILRERDTGTNTIKILSYNVLFNNHKLHKRMEALGGLILCHLPDVICFQEVTPKIYGIFEKSNWWNLYSFSVLYETMNMKSVKNKPFFCMQLSKLPVNSTGFVPSKNFGTRKKISMVEIKVCQDKSLVVATSHLKCATAERTFSKKRVKQAKTALNLLENYPNVIFGGDMNWNEEVDGKFPLLDGWVDAWTKLRPHEKGWTYDTKSNPMLNSQVKVPLQKRFDRFICNLHDFKLKKIDMIGTEAILGLPCVLPSDHYGLLLEVQSK